MRNTKAQREVCRYKPIKNLLALFNKFLQNYTNLSSYSNLEIYDFCHIATS